MYLGDLSCQFRLRMSSKDFDFLTELAQDRAITVSELVRSIIAEYRRSCVMVSALQSMKGGAMSYGDEQANFHDKL